MIIYDKIRNLILIKWFKIKGSLEVGKGLILRGKPIIDIRDGARIDIGRNVTLNSENYGYHINIHSPVKLFANISKNAYLKIGDNTRIHGACLHARERIEVGKNCLIAGNCQIFDCSAHHLSMDNPQERKDTKGETEPIVIEDNVWICAHAIILPGVRIGCGSVVAAGSVVTKNVPPGVIVGGNPATIIQKQEFKIWKEDES